jgi:hypothetical protein
MVYRRACGGIWPPRSLVPCEAAPPLRPLKAPPLLSLYSVPRSSVTSSIQYQPKPRFSASPGTNS